MSPLLRVLGLVAGVVLGAMAFDQIATRLQASAFPWVWHAGIATLALPAFGLARSRPGLRPLLTAFGATLVALVAFSALMVPDLIRASATEVADGRPFCILGTETSADPDARHRDPYLVGTALVRDRELTLLTLPRPLILVVEMDPPATDLPYGRKPDGVFATYTWRTFDRAFVETENYHLRRSRFTVLLDCVPVPDPFANADPAQTPGVLVVSRPRLIRADGTIGWGPRQRDLYHLPADTAPLHDGRFGSGSFGFSAVLLPGQTAFALWVRHLEAPTDWLDDRLRERVRDQDAPMDFATLARNGLGLHAYEVPSTSSDATDATYAAFAADGTARTVITCDAHQCRHHVLPATLAGPTRVVVSVSYPPDHLPDWQAIEAAATARFLASHAPP